MYCQKEHRTNLQNLNILPKEYEFHFKATYDKGGQTHLPNNKLTRHKCVY